MYNDYNNVLRSARRRNKLIFLMALGRRVIGLVIVIWLLSVIWKLGPQGLGSFFGEIVSGFIHGFNMTNPQGVQ